jgi:hypothetical protein
VGIGGDREGDFIENSIVVNIIISLCMRMNMSIYGYTSKIHVWFSH